MPRIIEGASGPAVRVGERPRGYKRGGITSTTWETARELMLRLVECPPARPIFEKASYALVQDGEGVLRLVCTKCLDGGFVCRCGDQDDERHANWAIALYEDPVIRAAIFDPLGIEVCT